MLTRAPATSYDALPYPGLCYTQSHPDRLATCARLLGLETAPVTRCRVLELGCAGGGNLIPMAYALPDSTFVGVDQSERQIDEATDAVGDLGLTNIAFMAMDLSDITPALGSFDYIVVHGVYSWVPPAVRDRLLAVCHDNLSPRGVAYVSYNTYPGWHMLQGLREMMLYHTRHQTDPHQRAEHARALIAFLYHALEDERNQAYGTLLETYRDLLEHQMEDARPRVDAALLHDELEEYNDPVYFWQFAEHAAGYGLQYLVEADFTLSMPNNLSEVVFDTLRGICETLVDTEQYMDFIRNRAFRRTLLCRDDLDIDRTLRTARVRDMAVATRAQRMAEDADAPQPGVARYASADGAIFQTEHPLTIAAMDHLAAISPQAVLFGDLVQIAARSLGQAPDVADEERTRLAANLLKAFTYSLSLVELHAYVPPFTMQVSERPQASPVARRQAAQGDQVANLRHERVRLDTLSRHILPLLDGEHTLEELTQHIETLVARGLLTVRQDDETELAPDQVGRRLANQIEQQLEWLARSALLVS